MRKESFSVRETKQNQTSAAARRAMLNEKRRQQRVLPEGDIERGNGKNATPAPRSTAKTIEERRQLRKQKRIARQKRLAAFLAVCAFACACIITGAAHGVMALVDWAKEIGGEPDFVAATYDMAQYERSDNDARLVLVNQNVALDALYQVTLSVADDATGMKLEQEAAQAYRNMALAANGDGVSLVLKMGYLDDNAQTAYYEACVQGYRDARYQEADAVARANTVTGAAGHNEYGTGYAAQIVCEEYEQADNGFAQTDAYLWLTCYAAEYGFVERYPQDRQQITGKIYQPWHWRYVGVENAKAMRMQGICLEEFLEQ